MQTPVCPLCNMLNNEERFSERGYKVFVCNVCGLFFINPYPSKNENVRDRVGEYNYDNLEIPDSQKQRHNEVEYYKRYFPLIGQECENADSVLDVGCGTGYLLERLSIYPNLFRAGIELNTARAEIAKKVSGCEIHQIPIEEFPNDKKFDVIIMINVFSHIPHFDSLYQSIRLLLKENGKIILKTGELHNDVRKRDIFDWGIPDHVHFLGLNTIDFICRKYKFKICKHVRIPLSEELFLPSTWKLRGRSAFRNRIKGIVAYTPFALPFIAKLYDITHEKRIYSSFIVLST